MVTRSGHKVLSRGCTYSVFYYYYVVVAVLCVFHFVEFYRALH